jgi:hypothetical protein
MAREPQNATIVSLSGLPAGVRTAMGSMMLRRATNGWGWRQLCIHERKAEMMARRSQK